MNRDKERFYQDLLCCFRIEDSENKFIIPHDSDYRIHDAFIDLIGRGGFSKDITSNITIVDTPIGGRFLEYGDILNNAFQSTMIEYGQNGEGFVFRISDGAANALLRNNRLGISYDVEEMKIFTKGIINYLNNND